MVKNNMEPTRFHVRLPGAKIEQKTARRTRLKKLKTLSFVDRIFNRNDRGPLFPLDKRLPLDKRQ